MKTIRGRVGVLLLGLLAGAGGGHGHRLAAAFRASIVSFCYSNLTATGKVPRFYRAVSNNKTGICMKRLFPWLIWLNGLFSAAGQGTVQFTSTLTFIEFHPNPYIFSSAGTFSLSNNVFRYNVRIGIAGYEESHVQGPGPDGPALFNLTHTGTISPIGTNLGSTVFSGRVTLPDSQLNDLLANQWYVSVTVSGDPGADLRGQILQVPEPQTTVLWGVGAAALSVRWLRRTKVRR